MPLKRAPRYARLIAAVAALAVLAPLPLASATAVAQTVIATVPVGDRPVSVAVNPTTNRIYVANRDDESVSVLDGATNTLIATIPVPDPGYMAVNQTTDRIYVGSGPRPNMVGSLSVIAGDADEVVATIPLDALVNEIAVNSATNRVYVALATDGTPESLAVIDAATNEILQRIPAGYGLWSIVLHEATNRLFVSNYLDNVVAVVDGGTNAVVARVEVGAFPRAYLAAHPGTGRVYAATAEDDTVWALDYHPPAAPVISVALTTPDPFALAVNASTGRLYVANRRADRVSIFDLSTATLLASVAVGSRPIAMALNRRTNRLYVVNFISNTVTVIEDHAAAAEGRDV